MLPTVSRCRPELVSLLEAISSTRRDLSLRDFSSRTIAWATQSGLGPLLYRAIKDNDYNSTSPHWRDLKAADLTARVVIAEHLSAMAEIIDACRDKVPPLALLKGISIAEEYYPQPHLRLMRDIDILIEKKWLPAVKIALEELGYRQDEHETPWLYGSHHHAAPFFSEQRNVWVEVHHALISPRRAASSARSFKSGTIWGQVRDSQFQGRSARRLTAELQLVYLATHWAQDFPTVGGVVAMVDAIYLLKSAQAELRWEWIVDSVRHSVAASHLYLLLNYLSQYRLISIPHDVMQDLFSNQPSFCRASLAAAHALLDRYCVAGTPMGRVLNKGVTLTWKALILARPALARAIHASS